MKIINVALADDHVLFVKGMKMILESHEHINLTIEAFDGERLIKQVASSPPDVVLLDLKMPKMDGYAVLQWLKKHYPSTKVLILTMQDENRVITHLLAEGAHGYLLKNESPEVVIHAIETVVKKGMFLNEKAAAAMLDQLKTHAPASSTPLSEELQALTDREIEVLKLICQEKTTNEIAETLFLSPRTIEGHRKNLLEKTGARNTAGLVLFAGRNNLI